MPLRCPHLPWLAWSLLVTAGCSRPAPDLSPTTSSPAPVDPTPLSPAQLARIEVLQKTFAEFDPDSLDKWIDDFKHERSPEKEIATYEAVATAYREYAARHTLNHPARREVYQLLLMRSSMPEEEVLLKARPALLSPDEVRQVLRSYPSTLPPSPAHS